MKKQMVLNSIVSTLLVAMTSTSFAVERHVRIEPDSVSDGFAIAWGIKGEKTDFEAIEAAGDEAVFQFLREKSDLAANYLIDVETETLIDVLAENSPDGYNEVRGHIGSTSLNNHFSVNIYTKVPGGEGLDFDQRFVIVSSGMKWTNEISAVYAIDRKRHIGKVTVLAKEKNIQEKLDTEIRKNLNKDQKERLDSGAYELSFSQKLGDQKGAVRFKILAYTPKSDDPKDGITIDGKFRLKLANGKIELKLLGMKAKNGSN